ncbi:TRAP-type C4-dicarboxylate transport system substrate-binding protein [Bradyrhizobium japonicum]|jgi:TRAP-type C4-dicarboxylate transport system substrate-binding protein|uniref:TRAP transporter substrate-binding protein n=1 Tax=Bradyrhizobium TaxID=374 RepID=UPI00038127F4|nr:TRAP transporter substrate-binding protein DctP [Bradyrhizobium elkanii]MCP1732801.1 TRAP-type C4-dicarboxylate transport system substrate-binding protein [Bradyrhizobium elkanii]MCS3524383.1 TRAP-type C4-dicarboxylate transport system substrate-binding protein [Bradyrhizobium elkanii]MCS3568139.1 TRAP-type C4-dicarboxylate transport system substrate-binding protein [Bradyrhizobium elkanii]MCS3590378.1 TRAP-type C4-dicarboxylate transport system substrate-binding protein [Bradyrhizobium elka
MGGLWQALAGYGFLIASVNLAAADPIKLRVADSFPKGHYLVRLVLEPWMAEVQKRTNNAVTFEHYPAQQLGKAADMLRLTQTGVADIGYVAPAYVSDKMPVSEVAMLPGAFEHSCQGTLAYWKSARSGVIAQQDYTANGIRLLLAVSLPPYRILTVKQPVKDVADINGLKLRSTGGAQDLTLRAIGAVPVRMAAPDAYESLSRGTMDGLLFPLESVVAYGADKLVNHSTEGFGFASFVVAYSISENAWKKLSPAIQKAMVDVAEEILPSACKEVQKQDSETMRSMETAGVRFDTLQSDVVAKLKDLTKGVSKAWADGLDARGKHGSDALKEFDAAVAAIPAK